MYAEVDIQPIPVLDGATPTYAFQIRNHLGEAVPLSTLATGTLTYYALPSLTVINTRNHQNILNANNVAITAEGLLTWDLQPADTTRVAGTAGLATHEACFEFSYPDSGTTRIWKHKVWFFITAGSLVAAAP